MRQLDSSPSTQTSKNSVSSRSRTRTVNSVTVKTRRNSRVGSRESVVGSRESAGERPGLSTTDSRRSTTDSLSSSSNGRSNRSVIFLFQVLEPQAESFDAGRESGFLVHLHDNRMQPRIGRRRFEPRRQAGEKTAECRVA